LQNLDRAVRNVVHTLSASLHELGQIQRQRVQPDCVASYEESLAINEAIDEPAAAATCAFNLGHAYENGRPLRDLEKAESWYRRSLQLRDERDALGRGRCLFQLGSISSERATEAIRNREAEKVVRRHVSIAFELCRDALSLFPEGRSA
jgi:TPR repeat protein